MTSYAQLAIAVVREGIAISLLKASAGSAASGLSLLVKNALKIETTSLSAFGLVREKSRRLVARLRSPARERRADV